MKKRAVILGNGRSGKAAARLLEGEGWETVILDGDDAFPVDARFDLCVTSPGIALTHAWQVAARAASVPVVSELQLGAERWRTGGGRMLGVTGSKGKSSVVKLIADAMNRAGRRATPCGNYGTPLCEVVLGCGDVRGAWAVVEVSSFQLETTTLPHDAFEAAAVLNLQEDHLDRHGSVEVYHALKLKLGDMALAFFPAALQRSSMRLPRRSAPGRLTPRNDGDGGIGIDAACCAIHGADRLMAGSYFDNEILRGNGECAVALMRAAGLGDGEIADGFARFEPLPHRMQPVCERGGVKWIDDSKATSLAALAAGVAMCDRPVRLIAGGLPKGDDPFSVIPYLRTGVKKVYLIGSCANQFHEAWREDVSCELCGTLDRAVEAVKRDACAGETVLLSPGTASFDQFKSYGARGDAFASLARAGVDDGDGCFGK